MEVIQMLPPNQGLRNSVTYYERTYSSIPGVPIAVPDFDVAVLQANGWTTYATVAAQVGRTLTASNGTWTNSPTSFTYQWNRAGTPIGGATASTYVPIAADVGNMLTVSVVATNSGGSSFPATSAATSAVTRISYDSGNLLTNTTAYSITNQSKPSYLWSYVDPIFGTTVTRITGDVGVTIPATGGTWPNVARHAYNMRPVWNVDESLMVLENVVGFGGLLFLDGNSYAPLFRGSPPANSAEYRWSHTDPNLFDWVGTSGTNAVFGTWNPRKGATVTTATFSGYTWATVGGKGNWSLDGNVVAVLATRVGDRKQVAFSVNLQLRTKSIDIDLAANGFLPFTDGGPRISPLGNLIYVSGALSAGQQQSDNAIIFDLQGNVIQTWLEYGVPSHFDLAVSVAGDEVAVGVVKTVTQGVRTGHIAMRNLRTGVLTDLVTGGYSTAVSTRNYGMLGWAIVDDVDAHLPNNYPPYNDEIFAVKLDGSKTVVRLGQSHARYTDYDTQGFAVPSPSGTRIVFASDWNASGNPSRPVQTYVIDIRKNLGLP